MRFRWSLSIVLLFLLSGGCDSGVPWKSGPYHLLWIDVPEDVGLFYEVGLGGSFGLLEPRVFAVGANDEYVVAQQHPKGDKAITNFFIIEIHRGEKPDLRRGIIGPLSQDEYEAKAAVMRLPPFSKTLDSLR